jgi:hypothetical protein
VRRLVALKALPLRDGRVQPLDKWADLLNPFH